MASPWPLAGLATVTSLPFNVAAVPLLIDQDTLLAVGKSKSSIAGEETLKPFNISLAAASSSTVVPTCNKLASVIWYVPL